MKNLSCRLKISNKIYRFTTKVIRVSGYQVVDIKSLGDRPRVGEGIFLPEILISCYPSP